MQVFNQKLAAWTMAAALGTAGLLAAQTPHRMHKGMGRVMAQLNLTDAQKAQAKTIFQESRTTAQPIRQQLRQTRQSLQAAIKAGDANQIQQLSATEGTQLGQMAAVRNAARAKLYATLTPDQQQKLAAIQAARKQHRQSSSPGE